MIYGNIVKQLKKDGYSVEPMQFAHMDCLGVNGTALVDLIDGEVKETDARYSDVVKQIQENKSHIYTKEHNIRRLSKYEKL